MSLHTFLWWCHAQELFGLQIPVTSGGFELEIYCIQSSYLTHLAIRSNRLGGFREPEWKRFAVQTLLWSLAVVIQIIPGFELTFQSSIVKNSYKILLVLVLPKSAPWLRLRDRKCWNFACYRFLENAFFNVNYGI